MWLNEFEVREAVRSAKFAGQFSEEMPVAVRAAELLQRLVDWTNDNSDGWPHWKKPANAASKLMDLLYHRFYSAWEHRINSDITEEELAAALRPIKSFLTRQGVAPEVKTEILEGSR